MPADAPTYAEVLDALIEMVNQHCWDNLNRLDSMALSTNADAMRLLARAGKLEITTDRGRRVLGRWK